MVGDIWGCGVRCWLVVPGGCVWMWRCARGVCVWLASCAGGVCVVGYLYRGSVCGVLSVPVEGVWFAIYAAGVRVPFAIFAVALCRVVYMFWRVYASVNYTHLIPHAMSQHPLCCLPMDMSKE